MMGKRSGERDAAANEAVATDARDGSKRKRPHRKLKIILIAAAVLIVAVVGVFGFLAVRGVIAPSDVAAKYGTLSYIQEDEVTAYVDTYREQMGYGGDDDAWAEFLYDNGLTPDLMRISTIRQLIIDAEVERKAAQLGLAVDESEVDDYIQSMKDTIALGSDTIWEETLEMYGTTESQVRETYAHALLENLLFQSEVPTPDVTEDEVFDYLVGYYSTGLTTKHVYYLTVEVEDGEDELEVLSNVQQIRDIIASYPDLTAEAFGDYVTLYCTDEDVVSRGGANGWDLDMGDYSETYQTVVENIEVGQVSDVFNEDGAYSIIWIDEQVELPDVSGQDTDEIDSEDYLSVIPDTLMEYFSDCVALIKWNSDCQDYLQSLYDDSNPVLYSVSGVLPSYYVDMSAYANAEDDEETSDDAGEGTSEGDDSSEASSDNEEGSGE